MSRSDTDVVVVGGGITGLAAGWELARAKGTRTGHLTVLEAGTRLGGKIGSDDLAGRAFEAGPDAFIARVPDAVNLCRELGLADDLVAPAASAALIWSRGQLLRLPPDTVLGVPTRLTTLAASNIVSFPGVARAGLDLVLPADTSSGDRSVAKLIDARLGREVRDRLVDPLIGGIHAGSTEHLSLAATAPQLEAARCEHRSLMRALRKARTAPADGPAPTFLTLPDGLGQLVDVLARHLLAREVELRTVASVDKLERDNGRWQVTTSRGPVLADAVVLAVPSFVAADLLSPQLPDAAAELEAIEHASVVLATFTYPVEAVSIPSGVSGFLVPRVEGRLMTACTFLSAKWPHLARAGQSLIRVSAGRWGDERAVDLAEDELIGRLRDELKDSMGIAGPPDAVTISRWPRSFPQYQVGHLERVARIRAGVARLPGLAVAGASYEGVGIPACIGQGRRAATAVLESLATGSGSSAR